MKSLLMSLKIMNTYPDMNICIGMATVFGCPFEGLPKLKMP